MGVVSGPDHIYEVVNPLYLELIEKSDIIGKSVKDVLPSVVGQGIIKMLDKVYNTGETFHVSEMFLKFDYDENTSGKFLNFTCQAHQNDKGEVDGIFFFAVDVSEQVLSRKKLETSQARLTEAQAISKLGNWEVDLVTNSHYWSDEVYQIFGINKEDAVPGEAAFMAFVHPEDVAHAYNQINHGFLTNENITFDFRFIKKDGSLRHGYNEWKFKFDENGKPEILAGILQDVTDWRDAEQQLKNSEAFSRGVLDSLTSNIGVIDFSGVIVAINQSWKTFGIENGDDTLQGTGIGSNYFKACEVAIAAGVDYAAAAFEGIKSIMDNKEEVFYLEYPCHSPQQRRWFGMRVMKFEGNQELVVISHHDITGRKQAEFERTKVAKDLIQRNKDLEQFTYMVSHNLRAPVANILGLVGVLGSEGLIAEEKEKLNEGLFDSVNKLDDVVKDLNLILQVKGEMKEKNETVNFSKLVEHIKISIKNLIDMDVIDIQHDFSEINEFSTLKTYLHSIFYNLITNSIKYRQLQIPCFITIKSHLIGDQVVLTFTDNSLGIDLHKRGDQIFGLYKRFHSHVEGKGLGLFMVKTQVEKLGGKISVQSEVNKGTEFRIEFGE